MIKFYHRRNLVEGLNLALKYRLFVSGWCLSSDLCSARSEVTVNPPAAENYSVALYFKDQVPVAICFRHHAKIQAFCKKSERKKGYASKCVDKVKGQHQYKQWCAGSGVEGSHVFWSKQGIAEF